VQPEWTFGVIAPFWRTEKPTRPETEKQPKNPMFSAYFGLFRPFSAYMSKVDNSVENSHPPLVQVFFDLFFTLDRG